MAELKETVDALIKELDSDDFVVRENATRKLFDMERTLSTQDRKRLIDLLLNALSVEMDPEVNARLNAVLDNTFQFQVSRLEDLNTQIGQLDADILVMKPTLERLALDQRAADLRKSERELLNRIRVEQIDLFKRGVGLENFTASEAAVLTVGIQDIAFLGEFALALRDSVAEGIEAQTATGESAQLAAARSSRLRTRFVEQREKAFERFRFLRGRAVGEKPAFPNGELRPKLEAAKQGNLVLDPELESTPTEAEGEARKFYRDELSKEFPNLTFRINASQSGPNIQVRIDIEASTDEGLDQVIARSRNLANQLGQKLGVFVLPLVFSDRIVPTIQEVPTPVPADALQKALDARRRLAQPKPRR